MQLKPRDNPTQDRSESDLLPWLKTIRFYFALLGDLRAKFIAGFLIIFLISFYQLVPPLLIGHLVNQYNVGIEIGSLAVWYAGALAGAHALATVIRVNAKAYVTGLRNTVGYRIRVSGFDRILRKQLNESKALTGGEAQQIMTGVSDFYELTRVTYNEIFTVLSGFVGSVAIFLTIDAKFALFPILYLPMFLLLAGYFSKKVVRLNYALAKANESSTGTMVDSLGNALTIRSMGVRQEFGALISNRAAEVQRLEQALRLTSRNQWKLFHFLNGVILALFLYAAIQEVVAGSLLIGSVVIFFGYMQTLVTQSGYLLEVWESLQKYRASLSRLSALLGISQAGMEAAGRLKDWETVAFQNVGFTYPDGAAVLHDVTCSIRRGERIGLVGSSGSGKTTLAKLLIGLHSPSQGNISVDGIALSHLSLDAIADQFGIALQECEIFGLTLRENITLMRELSEERLLAVLKTSGLEGLIQKLPDGLDTMVGEKGYKLSGGERQRVSLARALCKSPSLLILDEATVMLDATTEETVLAGILELLPNAAVIVIAHHERTLRVVDRSWEIRDGKLFESELCRESVSSGG